MTDTDRITELERLAEILTAKIAALKAPKFGVGSWVELTEDFSPWAKAGAQGIVAGPNTETGSWVDFKHGEYKAPGHWSCPNDKLRQIDEPKPAAPEWLKVGDWVEVTETSPSIGVEKGQRGVIILRDGTSVPYLVKFESGKERWVVSSRVKPIDPHAPKPEHKYKVGDRVAFIDEDNGYLTAGTIAELLAGPFIRGKGPSYLVTRDDGKCGDTDPRGWIVTEDKDQMRITDTPAPAKPAPLKYKAGDYVLVPMKVTEVDPEDRNGWVYELMPISGRLMEETSVFANRATLEPARPQVGQRVVAFRAERDNNDKAVGKLTDDDHTNLPFEVDDQRWYNFAYTLPD